MKAKTETNIGSRMQYRNSLAAQAGMVLLCLGTTIGMAQTYVVLHDFNGTDGSSPQGDLVLSGTTLYGTTFSGGSNDYGTVFEVNTDGGGYAVLHSFTGTDGAHPSAGLVLSGTTLYGTATWGGGFGGTVFKLNTDGSGFTVLKQFDSGGPAAPVGGLVLSGTTLYGTTEYSYSYGGSVSGCGTVFRINTDGSGYTLLREFSGSDGLWPCAALLLDGTTLYGTTSAGGSVPDYNCGTVFKMNTDGTAFTQLMSFTGTNGNACFGSLVLSGTTLFGTTLMGGDGGGEGTVFKINTDGSGFALLRSFHVNGGQMLESGLELSGTTLYGTTFLDDVWNVIGNGAIFQINTDGSGYTVLKQFTGIDGRRPYARLLLSGTTLYGATSQGGISGNGVVFSLHLAPPEAPTVTMLGQSQTVEVGSTVDFEMSVAGSPPPICLWFCNDTNAVSDATTNCYLELTNVQFSRSGVYMAVITNVAGAVTSAPVMLNVIPAVERRPVPAVNLTGDPGSILNIDCASILTPAPDWSALDSVNLTGTSGVYFDLSDPRPPQRFYRAWQTGTPTITPTLKLPGMVPAITLTGNIGDKLRLDYINQFGPTDAWVTLDTIKLTSKSQLYFDVSAIGQPPRLWRIVPVP